MLNMPLIAQHFSWAEIAAVPIVENGNPLETVAANRRIRVRPAYFEQNIPHAPEKIYLRREVIARLHAALALLPPNLGLEILDGWRPLAVQAALREQFRQKLVAEHPAASIEEVARLVDTFTADPDNPDMPPPHNTGGSVDLTLFDTQTGVALNMGTAFDDPADASFSHALELGSHPAKIYRRWLINAMKAAGFSNFPTEWWHFDYGNQNWAYFTKQPAAIFGETHFSDGIFA